MLAPALSAAVLGTMLGSMIFGPLADRFNAYAALATAQVLAGVVVLSMMCITASMPYAFILGILFAVGFMMAAGGISGRLAGERLGVRGNAYRAAGRRGLKVLAVGNGSRPIVLPDRASRPVR